MIDLRVGRARVRFTGRDDGDLAHAGRWVEPGAVDPAVAARRRAVCALPWTWLRQEHGAAVVTVDAPGAGSGSVADASVTAVAGAALAVFSADCAPVALVADGGDVVAAVHAGWRGLVAGVVEAAVAAVQQAGGRRVEAVLGPCIRSCCYEFGPRDLATVEARLGPAVRSTTDAGAPALDVPAGVHAALRSVGVEDLLDVGACTAHDERWFSHRARGEVERQALVVWR